MLISELIFVSPATKFAEGQT